MGKKLKLWTSMVLGASFSVGTGFWFAGCKKSEDEIKSENEIRKILEFEAKIDLSDNQGFTLDYDSKDDKYLLTFGSSNIENKSGEVIKDEITYSVDEDTFYNFKKNYSVEESQKEIYMVYELAIMYDPVKVISKNKEVLNKFKNDFVM